MVSTLLHILIGTSIFLLLDKKFKFKPKSLYLILFAAFVSVIPDLDLLLFKLLPSISSKFPLEMYHRIFFHNLFFIAFILIFYIYLIKRKIVSSLIFSTVFLSHLFFDLFDNGVPLLYPLSEKLFLIYPLTQYTGMPYKLFWDGNIMLSILSAILFIMVLIFKLNKKEVSHKFKSFEK